MRVALSLAEYGRATVSPNPMVGCVIVAPDGTRVGRGSHERAGEPHAEILALRHAGERARGATMYVTLEPCCHSGRTGPCVVPIVAAGIARVVAAVQDPNPAVAGRGLAYLRAQGVEVTVGVLEAEATRLNEAFFTAITLKRPHVTLKIAVTSDGFVARPGGGPTAISSAEALHHAHLQRAWVDALAVGVGTVLADDPRLTARGVFRPRPLVRVVFDSGLRTPPSARLLATRDAGPILLMTTARAMEQHRAEAAALTDAGAECLPCSEHDIRDGLAVLNGREVRSLILEGGPTLHRAAWDAGVVDRLQVYESSQRLGDGVRWSLDGPRLLAARPGAETVPLGPDRLIDVDVHRTR